MMPAVAAATATAATKTELDLFAAPKQQTCIVKGSWVEYQPLSSLESEGPVEFNIPASANEYIDLQQTQILVRGSIEGDEDGEIKVAPVNLLLGSLFGQVDMYFNDVMVSAATNLYSYRAYLETLLNYGPAAKKSSLTSSFWYKDTAGHMDSVDFTSNKGLQKRHELTNKGKTFELCGGLHLDMCFQDKLLPNGIGIKIRMIRNKPSFYLMADADANKALRIKLEKVVLYVRRVTLSPACLLAQARVNLKAPMKYPYSRVVCRLFALPAGFNSGNIDNAVLGMMPRRLIIGMVKNTASNGSFKENPFNFHHYDLNYLCAHLDGEQFPSKAFQPDYDKKLFSRSYMSLFTGLNTYAHDSGNDISTSEYNQGFTLYCLDLSPDLNEGGHINVRKHGSLRLEMTFKKPLPHTINVLLYCEYENMIQITADRQISLDF